MFKSESTIPLHRTELFLLFYKITSANEAYSDFIPQLLKNLQHCRGRRLSSTKSLQGHTFRAGVRVPSTSNRTSVFLIGRSDKGGNSSCPIVMTGLAVEVVLDGGPLRDV